MTVNYMSNINRKLHLQLCTNSSFTDNNNNKKKFSNELLYASATETTQTLYKPNHDIALIYLMDITCKHVGIFSQCAVQSHSCGRTLLYLLFSQLSCDVLTWCNMVRPKTWMYCCEYLENQDLQHNVTAAIVQHNGACVLLYCIQRYKQFKLNTLFISA